MLVHLKRIEKGARQEQESICVPLRSKNCLQEKFKVKWYMTRHCDGFRLTRVDSYITHLLRFHRNFPFGKHSETHQLVGATGNKKYMLCRLRRMTTPRLTVVMLNVVIMTFLFVLFSHGLGLACKSKAALLRSPIPPPLLPVSARGKSVWEFTLRRKKHPF